MKYQVIGACFHAELASVSEWVFSLQEITHTELAGVLEWVFRGKFYTLSRYQSGHFVGKYTH